MISALLSVSTLILIIIIVILMHKLSKHIKNVSGKVSSMAESLEKNLDMVSKISELSDAIDVVKRRMASLSTRDIEESIFELTRVLQKMSQLLSQQAMATYGPTPVSPPEKEPEEREVEVALPTDITSIDEIGPIVIFRYDGTVVEYSGIEQPTKKAAYMVESIRNLDEAEVKNDVILMPEVAVLKLPMGLYAAIFKKIDNIDIALKIREVLSKYVEGYRGS
ncbi:MAG: hypothetical protein DRN53_01650 [Thermoprotei archaeon]|nr:MAG: hypothetical protein DRN53_01650 [Thermoprotei archaeon]